MRRPSFPVPMPVPRKKIDEPLHSSIRRWNFDTRLPQHWNFNPAFERRPDRMPQALNEKDMANRGHVECSICGRKYMFDTGFRRVDCECGISFFAPTMSKPDIRLRESIGREMRARKEAKQKR